MRATVPHVVYRGLDRAGQGRQCPSFLQDSSALVVRKALLRRSPPGPMCKFSKKKKKKLKSLTISQVGPSVGGRDGVVVGTGRRDLRDPPERCCGRGVRGPVRPLTREVRGGRNKKP